MNRLLIFVLAIILLLSACNRVEKINTSNELNRTNEMAESLDNPYTRKEPQSNIQANNLTNDTDLISDRPELLSQFGLPLIGDNIFDPKEVNVGDFIMGLKLMSNECTVATEDYPFDTNVAVFEGEVILTGTIGRVQTDSEITPGAIYFSADEKSTLLLPISHHDTRVAELKRVVILFDNQEYAQNLIEISPGESIDNLKLKIDNYRYIYLANDLQCTATLINIVAE